MLSAAPLRVIRLPGRCSYRDREAAEGGTRHSKMAMTMCETPWHYVQISDALDEEFVAALSRVVPVTAWRPRMSRWALVRNSQAEEVAEPTGEPGLSQWSFPLQRGFARPPISWLARSGARLKTRLLRRTREPARTPLVCSTPYHAPLAEVWPGPVVYYLTDLIKAYAGADAEQVQKFDRRMCAVARLVCPNSTRLADYLRQECGCAAAKIRVLPNATRRVNLVAEPLDTAGPLPSDAEDLSRPVAGVIGNMGGNVDWGLLLELIRATPQFSWLMVGPVKTDVVDSRDRTARETLLQMGGRVRFVGKKPYGELAAYARSFDVAVLPYRRREPTFSGSSTRFYEHLAATRPIVSTRGFEELLHKEPLLRLIDTAEQGVVVLHELERRGFQDGQMEARWTASRDGTWDRRAETLVAELQKVLA